MRWASACILPRAKGRGLLGHCSRSRTSICSPRPTWRSSRYVFDAVAAIKRALSGRVPLIGFAGSPFTLACYMIEGAGSADFGRVRRMLYSRPDLLHRVLAINADAVGEYLAQQVEHGADVLMIFDTWGGLLSADAYRGVLARVHDARDRAAARARRRRCP